MTCLAGWADLKEEHEKHFFYYETSFFQTREEAQAELSDILSGTDNAPEDWRIVTEDIPEDQDVYNFDCG
jgi:hypothetical protein